jgi:hypothetical protein
MDTEEEVSPETTTPQKFTAWPEKATKPMDKSTEEEIQPGMASPQNRQSLSSTAAWPEKATKPADGQTCPAKQGEDTPEQGHERIPLRMSRDYPQGTRYGIFDLGSDSRTVRYVIKDTYADVSSKLLAKRTCKWARKLANMVQCDPITSYVDYLIKHQNAGAQASTHKEAISTLMNTVEDVFDEEDVEKCMAQIDLINVISYHVGPIDTALVKKAVFMLGRLSVRLTSAGVTQETLDARHDAVADSMQARSVITQGVDRDLLWEQATAAKSAMKELMSVRKNLQEGLIECESPNVVSHLINCANGVSTADSRYQEPLMLGTAYNSLKLAAHIRQTQQGEHTRVVASVTRDMPPRRNHVKIRCSIADVIQVLRRVTKRTFEMHLEEDRTQNQVLELLDCCVYMLHHLHQEEPDVVKAIRNTLWTTVDLTMVTKKAMQLVPVGILLYLFNSPELETTSRPFVELEEKADMYDHMRPRHAVRNTCFSEIMLRGTSREKQLACYIRDQRLHSEWEEGLNKLTQQENESLNLIAFSNVPRLMQHVPTMNLDKRVEIGRAVANMSTYCELRYLHKWEEGMTATKVIHTMTQREMYRKSNLGAVRYDSGIYINIMTIMARVAEDHRYLTDGYLNLFDYEVIIQALEQGQRPRIRGPGPLTSDKYAETSRKATFKIVKQILKCADRLPITNDMRHRLTAWSERTSQPSDSPRDILPCATAWPEKATQPVDKQHMPVVGHVKLRYIMQEFCTLLICDKVIKGTDKDFGVRMDMFADICHAVTTSNHIFSDQHVGSMCQAVITYMSKRRLIGRRLYESYESKYDDAKIVHYGRHNSYCEVSLMGYFMLDKIKDLEALYDKVQIEKTRGETRSESTEQESEELRLNVCESEGAIVTEFHYLRDVYGYYNRKAQFLHEALQPLYQDIGVNLQAMCVKMVVSIRKYLGDTPKSPFPGLLTYLRHENSLGKLISTANRCVFQTTVSDERDVALITIHQTCGETNTLLSGCHPVVCGAASSLPGGTELHESISALQQLRMYEHQQHLEQYLTCVTNKNEKPLMRIIATPLGAESCMKDSYVLNPRQWKQCQHDTRVTRSATTMSHKEKVRALHKADAVQGTEEFQGDRLRGKSSLLDEKLHTLCTVSVEDYESQYTDSEDECEDAITLCPTRTSNDAPLADVTLHMLHVDSGYISEEEASQLAEQRLDQDVAALDSMSQLDMARVTPTPNTTHVTDLEKRTPDQVVVSNMIRDMTDIQARLIAGMSREEAERSLAVITDILNVASTALVFAHSSGVKGEVQNLISNSESVRNTLQVVINSIRTDMQETQRSVPSFRMEEDLTPFQRNIDMVTTRAQPQAVPGGTLERVVTVAPDVHRQPFNPAADQDWTHHSAEEGRHYMTQSTYPARMYGTAPSDQARQAELAKHVPLQTDFHSHERPRESSGSHGIPGPQEPNNSRAPSIMGAMFDWTAEDLINLANQQRVFLTGPHILAEWLVRQTGRMLKYEIKALVQLSLEGVTSLEKGTLKPLDYKVEVYSTTKNRKVYPDPANTWSLINRAKDCCLTYQFTYLFNCIPTAPVHILREANESLVQAFVNDKLGEHLNEFSVFTNVWLRNLPDLRDRIRKRGRMYSGTTAMEIVYEDLILLYFTQKRIEYAQYFDYNIKLTDLTARPLEDTLELLLNQYGMQCFISGGVSEACFKKYERTLCTCFNQYTNTCEYEMSIRWHQYLIPYRAAKELEPHCDPFIWLIQNIKADIPSQVKATVYELYVSNKLIDTWSWSIATIGNDHLQYLQDMQGGSQNLQSEEAQAKIKSLSQAQRQIVYQEPLPVQHVPQNVNKRAVQPKVKAHNATDAGVAAVRAPVRVNQFTTEPKQDHHQTEPKPREAWTNRPCLCGSQQHNSRQCKSRHLWPSMNDQNWKYWSGLDRLAPNTHQGAATNAGALNPGTGANRVQPGNHVTLREQRDGQARMPTQASARPTAAPVHPSRQQQVGTLAFVPSSEARGNSAQVNFMEIEEESSQSSSDMHMMVTEINDMQVYCEINKIKYVQDSTSIHLLPTRKMSNCSPMLQLNVLTVYDVSDEDTTSSFKPSAKDTELAAWPEKATKPATPSGMESSSPSAWSGTTTQSVTKSRSHISHAVSKGQDTDTTAKQSTSRSTAWSGKTTQSVVSRDVEPAFSPANIQREKLRELEKKAKSAPKRSRSSQGKGSKKEGFPSRAAAMQAGIQPKRARCTLELQQSLNVTSELVERDQRPIRYYPSHIPVHGLMAATRARALAAEAENSNVTYVTDDSYMTDENPLDPRDLDLNYAMFEDELEALPYQLVTLAEAKQATQGINVNTQYARQPVNFYHQSYRRCHEGQVTSIMDNVAKGNACLLFDSALPNTACIYTAVLLQHKQSYDVIRQGNPKDLRYLVNDARTLVYLYLQELFCNRTLNQLLSSLIHDSPHDGKRRYCFESVYDFRHRRHGNLLELATLAFVRDVNIRITLDNHELSFMFRPEWETIQVCLEQLQPNEYHAVIAKGNYAIPSLKHEDYTLQTFPSDTQIAQILRKWYQLEYNFHPIRLYTRTSLASNISHVCKAQLPLMLHYRIGGPTVSNVGKTMEIFSSSECVSQLLKIFSSSSARGGRQVTAADETSRERAGKEENFYSSRSEEGVVIEWDDEILNEDGSRVDNDMPSRPEVIIAGVKEVMRKRAATSKSNGSRSPNKRSSVQAEIPQVVIQNLHTKGDCIYHTLRYLATGESLTSEGVEQAKLDMLKCWHERKSPLLRAMCGDYEMEGRYLHPWCREQSGCDINRCRLHQVGKGPGFAWMCKHDQVEGCERESHGWTDEDARSEILEQHNGSLSAIAGYSAALSVNVEVYLKGGYFLFEHDHNYKTIQVFVGRTSSSRTYHIYGLSASNPAHSQIVLEVDVNKRPKSRHNVSGIMCETNVLTLPGTSSVKVSECRKYRPGDRVWNETVRWRIRAYSCDQEDQAAGDSLETIKCCMMRSVTKHCNEVRNEASQESLVEPPLDADMQGHDPGAYGRAMTIFNTTNQIRQLWDQEPLATSEGKADMDMYHLHLHEKQQQMFYAQESDDPKEAEPEKKEEIERVFLSNMAVRLSEYITFLWDSGASRTVIGKGALAKRILEDYLLLFNHDTEGWADNEEMSKKVKPGKQLRRNIVVASGQTIQGTALPRIDIGVNACTQSSKENKWRRTKKQVFLTLTDASVAEGIHTNIIAKAHFMIENPNFTLITRGLEKYLVWGKPNITFEPINGQAPVRIDLRYENGGHYMDIHTAMLVKALVGQRKRQESEAATSEVLQGGGETGVSAEQPAKFIHVNTMSTVEESNSVSDVTTDTDDLLCTCKV